MPPGPPPNDPLTATFIKFFGAPPPTSDEFDIVMGVAGAHGVVRGTARIMRSIRDSHRLQPGDIIVAEATATPWTPFFAVAAGIVTDSGGFSVTRLSPPASMAFPRWSGPPWALRSFVTARHRGRRQHRPGTTHRRRMTALTPVDILWLDDAAACDVSRTGGKAANLSRLAVRHPVPTGFCLTAVGTARCRGSSRITSSN